MLFRIIKGIKGIRFSKNRFKLNMSIYERPDSVLDVFRWLLFAAFFIVTLPMALLDSLEIVYEAN